MKKKIIILIFLFVNYFSFSQIHIIGKVIENSNTPLECASLYLINSKTGTITNKNGNFILFSKYKKDTLIISYVGFKTKKILIIKDTTINIKLFKETEKIKEVIINAFSDKDIAKLILVAKKNQKQNKYISETTSKTFSRSLSIKNDSIITEYFEALYSTTHSNIKILKNNLKAGKINSNKLNKNKFYTLDFYNYFLPRINIFSLQKKSILLNNPLLCSFTEEITSTFKIDYRFVTTDKIKIFFQNRNNNNNNGYIVINTKNKIIERIIINSLFVKDKIPFYSVNKKYTLQNYKINMKIIFNNNTEFNYPFLFSFDITFDYQSINPPFKKDKYHSLSNFIIYDYHNKFSNPIPILNNLTDYEALSIIPNIKEIWKYESLIQKNITIDTSNMYNLFFESPIYEKYYQGWHLNWNKIRKISYWWENHYNLNMFISLNYYKYNNKYFFNTSAILDYSKSHFSLENNEINNKFINETFKTTDSLGVLLVNKLNSLKNINNKIINKEYDNYMLILKKEKKKIEQKYNNYLFLYKNNAQ